MRNKDAALPIPLLFSIFVFLICACATPPRPFEEAVDQEATAMVEKLRREGRSPEGMQALAEVKISAYGKKHSLRLAVVLKKPGKLRAESIPVIGTPDFFVTVNDQALKAYLPHDGVFYIGKPTPSNLEKFIPLKLPVRGLADLLMGAAPDMGKEVRWRIGLREGDVFRIDGFGQTGQILSLWIDPAKNRLLKTVLCDAGAEPLYTFYYQDFSEGGKTVPRQIQIVVEQQPSRLTLQYRDIEYAPDEAENVFDLVVPAAAQIIYLD
jgi:outer membrane lipoprotein-sorting protein